MDDPITEARALFLFLDGSVHPDDQICSGAIPPQLKGQPCPYSEGGRMPKPEPISEVSARSAPDRGAVGDLAPPCALRHLGRLADWEGEVTLPYPPPLGPLRLFKCRQMFLLVVPGLREGRAWELRGGETLEG